MTVSELRSRSTFVVLTIAQQKFLEAYLSTGGDIMESVFVAYGTRGDTAKRRARILINTRYIHDLIVAINVNKMSKENVLTEASIIAQTSKSDLAKVKALNIVAQLSGYLEAKDGRTDLEEFLRKLDEGQASTGSSSTEG